MSESLANRKRILALSLITSLSLVVLISLCVYFIDFQKCTVSDYDPVSPYEQTYSSFTKGMACRKAVAMCQYYNKPGHCKIKP
ncbi:MAG: hypothetical protein ACOYL6_10925 [Bacteriovoracaceae bacterium]